VVLVENSTRVLSALAENARLLDADGRLEIVAADAVKFASSRPSTALRFDVLFLDPPYKQGWLERVAPLLPALMADNGVLYVEAEHTLDACGEWRTVRRGRAGQVFYHLMRRGEADGAE